jgi:hypothetical protein
MGPRWQRDRRNAVRCAVKMRSQVQAHVDKVQFGRPGDGTEQKQELPYRIRRRWAVCMAHMLSPSDRERQPKGNL